MAGAGLSVGETERSGRRAGLGCGLDGGREGRKVCNLDNR